MEEHPEPAYTMDFALDSDTDDDGKVICWICPLALSNLSDAERHFEEKHTGFKVSSVHFFMFSCSKHFRLRPYRLRKKLQKC